MKIALLYGTETGNTEMLCEDIEAGLDGDHEVSIANLEDTDPATLDPETLYLLVCSTYGDGDLPASAQPFAEAMDSAAPDLSAIRFAVFGMGDSSYETFNEGSEKLEALMLKYGAVAVNERVTFDVMGDDMAEDRALPWAEESIAHAANQLADS